MKFKFRAKNREGQMVEGERESADRLALARELRPSGLTLFWAEPVAVPVGWKKLMIRLTFGRVKLKDKILFAGNLASMLEAGLPLARALDVISRQNTNQVFQPILQTLAQKIRNGESFSQALGSFPEVFPPVFVAMVAAGEESGKLTGALAIVRRQMERNYNLRRKVRGAMLYPLIIVIAIIIIAVVMMIFLVPTLTGLFTELNVELPLSTRLVIAVSNFLSHYPVLALSSAGLILALLTRLGRTRKGRRWLALFWLRLPVIREISRQMNAAVIMRTLSSLLSSGVSMVEALNITRQVLANPFFQESLNQAVLEVTRGQPLSKIFRDYREIYPPLVGELVEVGEETGDLPKLLLKGALFYESEVNQMTKNLSTIIEPVLMVLVGAAVGFFAISMIAPIYSLSSSF